MEPGPAAIQCLGLPDGAHDIGSPVPCSSMLTCRPTRLPKGFQAEIRLRCKTVYGLRGPKARLPDSGTNSHRVPARREDAPPRPCDGDTMGNRSHSPCRVVCKLRSRCRGRWIGPVCAEYHLPVEMMQVDRTGKTMQPPSGSSGCIRGIRQAPWGSAWSTVSCSRQTVRPNADHANATVTATGPKWAAAAQRRTGLILIRSAYCPLWAVEIATAG